MPQQAIESDVKGVVQLLAASANANFADKIAKALLRAGYRLDPGEFDPARIDAVVVLWTGVALDKPGLIDVAREAWKARRLTPVSIGRVEPPFGSRDVAPMDLAGWRGDDGDPRWRFVLSDIEALKARAALEPSAKESVSAIQVGETQPTAKQAAPQTRAQQTRAQQDALEPRLLDDLLTEEGAAPHHPARALWRNRLFPAAPMLAGGLGALAFAAGVSFMVGSIRSRPAPIEPVAAQSAPAEEEEDPARGASLALVRLAPGVSPPEDFTPADDVEPQAAPDNSAAEENTLETSPIPPETTQLAAVDEPSAPSEQAQDDEENETPEGPETLVVPRLKPEPPVEEPVAADLNQAALAALASAVEASARIEDQDAVDAPEDYLGDYFSDCEGCPDMAALNGGAFMMGARPDEQDRQPEETPQRRVDIGYRFAIATRETTFDQWALCVADGGCRNYEPDDSGWGRGARPVINVSYEDAAAYARWLSAKTGHYYRLPSEAEWEYAARAGTGGPFHYGDALSAEAANFNGHYPYRAGPAIFRGQTVPVTRFRHNAFGLFDMHGNVAEWTLDCWNPGHHGGPVTGVARIDGNCARRVVKGGGWSSPGWRLRSAARRGEDAETRNTETGFRVVRTLD
ncbi:SUMF1/EgtB/PvdO family nonheme iron enzyme [Hyphococcus sp.]|uniref:SUMF1/EgtB/PvdO family nonheme iron enzyme n=1 Tax=Hyphococcus sp. TaxID=2038636 RepID=UPI0035C737AB